MKPGMWFVCGALLAGFAVVNGAFAAHGLQSRLAPVYEDQPQVLGARLSQYETGVRYQMYHAVGLMLLAFVAARRPSPFLTIAGISFLLGIVIFSGMLYLLVLTNQPKLGMIVPIGGVAFILGWVSLAIGGYGALLELSTSP